jgi:hypothetical protein
MLAIVCRLKLFARMRMSDAQRCAFERVAVVDVPPTLPREQNKKRVRTFSGLISSRMTIVFWAVATETTPTKSGLQMYLTFVSRHSNSTFLNTLVESDTPDPES